MSSTLNCGSGGGSTTHTGLRIASLFIIWFGSTLGASFPIIARRSRFIRVPQGLFESVFFFSFSSSNFLSHFDTDLQNILAQELLSQPDLFISLALVSANSPLHVWGLHGKTMCVTCSQFDTFR
jgi:hypothetical protein